MTIRVMEYETRHSEKNNMFKPTDPMNLSNVIPSKSSNSML